MQKSIDALEILLNPDGTDFTDELSDFLVGMDENLQRQYRRYASECQEREDRAHTSCSIPDWSY